MRVSTRKKNEKLKKKGRPGDGPEALDHSVLETLAASHGYAQSPRLVSFASLCKSTEILSKKEGKTEKTTLKKKHDAVLRVLFSFLEGC